MPACFHCGLPVPAGASFGFAEGASYRAFCCAGCEAVSRAIAGFGLEDYYRLREAPAPRPDETSQGELTDFDTPQEQARFITRGDDGICEARLLVEGMRCAACAWLLEQALPRTPGVKRFEVNYATRQAWLRWDPGAAPVSTILSAVRRLGYAAWPYEETRVALVDARERRTLLRRFWIAGLGMMQVMMYAAPAYMASEGELGADAASLLRWAGMLLTAPVVAYSAWPFFAGAWRDLMAVRLGMDVPVALGIAAAFAASIAATVTGHGEVYFDSVTMFVFLLTGGRYLELLARGRAGESLQHLARLAPGASGIRVDDVVMVAPGMAVPADGIVEEGGAILSEAWLTGESRPLMRRRGELVLAGSVNAGQAFSLRATRVGAETALAKMHRMMERALAERPRWVLAAERASSGFVALVLLAALAAGLSWWVHDPSRALWIAVSVLIVTCPCAFALATPAAITVATGRLARANIAVTRGHALETLAAATDIVFDKTGTLTEGRPRLLETRTVRGITEAEALALAGALARWSAHPFDRALAAAAPATAMDVEQHEARVGHGIEALVDGRRVRLGGASFVAGLQDEHPRVCPRFQEGTDSVVYLGDAQGWIAAFRLGDRVREGAREAVEALRRHGLRIHLLSGDEEGVVRQVAGALGITHVTARATPERKLAYVRDLQARGCRVVMVGDGLNDAPVLAQADVSIAMGGGADLAQLRADAVLLSDRVTDLVTAFHVARRTRRVVRQNVAWALAYNAIVIPLAFAGLVTPLIAGIGMSASSLAVVANALRLRR
jgi:Cu2+-exporting ATPase